MDTWIAQNKNGSQDTDYVLMELGMKCVHYAVIMLALKQGRKHEESAATNKHITL
jgi:hypothetical protein